MRYRLLILLLLFQLSQFTASATHPAWIIRDTSYTYYILLAGKMTKESLRRVESHVKSYPQVISFQIDRFPPRYFRLTTTIPIDRKRFLDWLGTSDLECKYFGAGTAALETLLELQQKPQPVPHE